MGARLMLPSLANVYLPLLTAQVLAFWPNMPAPSTLAAQIEQETCISLTHSKCWNPKAELKTSREYGFGLGQLTVTPKFDNFKAAKTWDKSLAGWRWEDRFDPTMQLRALVIYDRNLYNAIGPVATEEDRLAFTFSAYNGGLGGVNKDRQVCRNTPGCNPNRWFGHVEQHSFRARTAVAGYGQSFFDINRGYVRNVLYVRRQRYLFLDKKTP